MGSPVQDSVNTTGGLSVSSPAAKEKDWDEMTPQEQAAARERAQRLIAEADKPDVTAHQQVEQTIDRMKQVFGEQKRHPIVLYQVTGAMRAQGISELPALVLGINGYNFVIPRAVPVNLPEDAIRNLYHAGEVSPQTMLSLGLLTPEELMNDMAAAQAVQQQIADKIKPGEM